MGNPLFGVANIVQGNHIIRASQSELLDKFAGIWNEGMVIPTRKGVKQMIHCCQSEIRGKLLQDQLV